jgi:hypothetical protein
VLYVLQRRQQAIAEGLGTLTGLIFAELSQAVSPLPAHARRMAIFPASEQGRAIPA